MSLTSYFSTHSVSADSSGVDRFTLSLPVSCTIDSGSSSTHTQSVINNQYYPVLGGSATNFTMYCNDKNGYIIYAIGASNGEEGNTNLVGDNGNNIATGVYPGNGSNTTSLPSSWSMKLNTNDTDLTLNSNYNDSFNLIPSTWTEVIRKQSGTVDSTVGSHASATYDAYINGIQAAGTYTGQVKYVMFHPSSATGPVTLAKAFENAGEQKVQATDPLTGESGEFYKMQDMTNDICNTADVFGAASELKLVDIRDSKIYWVAKLEDGHCWMTENLDLDLEVTPTNVAQLTSDNTNLKLYGSKGYDSSNGYLCSNASATCENGVITWNPELSTLTNLGNWVSDNNNPYSYDRGLFVPNGEMNGHGYAGNYYNWTAVIASNNSSSYSSNNTIAANSICPKGWKLPTIKDGFNKLNTIYNNSSFSSNFGLVSSPIYLIKSGYIDKKSVISTNDIGVYMASTTYSETGIYGLALTNYGLNTDNYFNKDYNGRRGGFSVRCLAE